MDENTNNQLQAIEFRNRLDVLEKAQTSKKLESLEIRVNSLETLLKATSSLVTLQNVKVNELEAKSKVLETKEIPKPSIFDFFRRK